MGNRKHSVNTVFTLLLLAVFALAAVFTLILGAKIYENEASELQNNFDARTSIIYLSEKIRTCPADDFEIRKVDDFIALVLTETLENQKYESWIFVSDGNLCETVVPAGSDILPQTGQPIMALKAFEVELTDGGIKITVHTERGQTLSTFVAGRTLL